MYKENQEPLYMERDRVATQKSTPIFATAHGNRFYRTCDVVANRSECSIEMQAKTLVLIKRS